MKLGIMQPYFFPYLGYFDLIHYADKWIVFDNVQYIRHGWINRNRILHPEAGWSYIVVPVRHERTMPIREVEIVQDGKWKQRILGQLRIYKKSAPFYPAVLNLVEACLAFDTHSISRLNVFALAKVCEYLGLNFEQVMFSEMEMELGEVAAPGDWALRISQRLGADEYVNPAGGEALFDRDAFSASDIKLTIRSLPPLMYDCDGFEFIPNLSILDVLMWNAPEVVKSHLDEHRNKG